MKKTISFLRRIIAVALVLILALGVDTVALAAVDNNHLSQTISGEGENPRFAIANAQEAKVGNINGYFVNEVKYSANAADDKAAMEAAKTIRDGMLARKSPIPVTIVSSRTDFSTMLNEIMKMAISEELAETPDAGDYLAWHYGGYKFSGSSLETDDGDFEYNISLKVTYYTTAEEEAQVTNRINAALNTLNLDNKTEYEKIRSIYDYVCKVCNYDYTTPESNLKKFSAYGALINGSAVCQGYSTLLYRMLKLSGIDNRIITSTNHCWNIAKLGDYYYNLDVTWDDSNYDEGKQYSYFLKCGPHFDDHKRQPEYNTNEFNARYEMAHECYTNYVGAMRCMAECQNHTYELVNTIPATQTSVGHNFYTCVVCGKQYNVEIKPTVQIVTNNNNSVNTTVTNNNVVTTNNVVVQNTTTKTVQKITVGKVTLKTVAAKSKGFTLKWNKVANATGYEIQYSTDSKFSKKNTKTVAINKNATTSKTLAKLKGNKKYYVRIRAYNNNNGAKTYSSWGTVKNVKTKK